MMKYDKFDLTGKVALCAGGSSGLGYQFARAMASAGEMCIRDRSSILKAAGWT